MCSISKVCLYLPGIMPSVMRMQKGLRAFTHYWCVKTVQDKETSQANMHRYVQGTQSTEKGYLVIPLLCCIALTWWSHHLFQFPDLQKSLDWWIHCSAWKVLSKELLAANGCGFCCCFFGLGIQASCTRHKNPYLPALHLRRVTKEERQVRRSQNAAWQSSAILRQASFGWAISLHCLPNKHSYFSCCLGTSAISWMIKKRMSLEWWIGRN